MHSEGQFRSRKKRAENKGQRIGEIRDGLEKISGRKRLNWGVGRCIVEDRPMKPEGISQTGGDNVQARQKKSNNSKTCDKRYFNGGK